MLVYSVMNIPNDMLIFFQLHFKSSSLHRVLEAKNFMLGLSLDLCCQSKANALTKDKVLWRS